MLSNIISTAGLVITALGLGGGGGILFYRLMKKERNVDITTKIEKLASEMLDQYRAELSKRDSVLEKIKDYMYEDADYHVEVNEEIRRLGGAIRPAPRAPYI